MTKLKFKQCPHKNKTLIGTGIDLNTPGYERTDWFCEQCKCLISQSVEPYKSLDHYWKQAVDGRKKK